MTEQEWQTANAPDALLLHLTAAASDRKLRLFACACCRRMWELLPEGASRRAVETSERFADGEIGADELQRSWVAARRLVASDEARLGGWNRLTAAEMEARDAARSGAWSAAHSVVADTDPEERQAQCDLLRDLFHPFHVFTSLPAWLTPEVTELAQQMYRERSFERMPALADALTKAGCQDPAVLAHCRGPGPHVRGCWVIDLLTGREAALPRDSSAPSSAPSAANPSSRGESPPMTGPPREGILALVASYGPDVLDMSGMLESELHLCCPDQREEVNTLVNALRHGLVHYLLVLAENGKLSSADLPAQVRRLTAEAGMSESEAEGAVHMWADVIAAMKIPSGGGGTWRQEPRGLHRTSLAALAPLGIVGAAGALASMLPWVVVVAERHGGHYLIPSNLSALGTHTLLNLAGAAGGFLGGAVGWAVGTPLSLEFVLTAGKASIHRVSVAVLAAALGSFLGLWLGYHHIADIGAFLGAFLGASAGAFLACVFTWDR
jgi:hypothetical protein